MVVADLLRRDEADALVREAHLNVHRHPAGFPGFRARLRLSTDDAVIVGRVCAPGDGPVAMDVPTDPSTGSWLERQLGSMAGDRRHAPYAEGDGRWAKDVHDGDDAPLGRVVNMADPLHSTYRVEQGHITRIGRTVDRGRQNVLIQDQRRAPDGRWVPTHFVVALQDEETGAMTSVDAYRDWFVAVEGVLLPARRRVTSLSTDGSAVREIVLEHHEVLA